MAFSGHLKIRKNCCSKIKCHLFRLRRPVHSHSKTTCFAVKKVYLTMRKAILNDTKTTCFAKGEKATLSAKAYLYYASKKASRQRKPF